MFLCRLKKEKVCYWNSVKDNSAKIPFLCSFGYGMVGT